MRVSACVCVCNCACVCACVSARACVSVCVSARARVSARVCLRARGEGGLLTNLLSGLCRSSKNLRWISAKREMSSSRWSLILVNVFVESLRYLLDMLFQIVNMFSVFCASKAGGKVSYSRPRVHQATRQSVRVGGGSPLGNSARCVVQGRCLKFGLQSAVWLI